MNTPDWSPFEICPPGQRPPPPRSLHTKEGVGDRLRAAAFAEIQAREAFHWASGHFQDAPKGLRAAWKQLADAENRHLGWLLKRMQDLEFEVAERPVSDQLWSSFMSCRSAEEFAIFMANAEERGRRAGERFYEGLRERDPISAEIFRKIAEEEVEHIALADRYFERNSKPEKTLPPRASESASTPSRLT